MTPTTNQPTNANVLAELGTLDTTYTVEYHDNGYVDVRNSAGKLVKTGHLAECWNWINRHQRPHIALENGDRLVTEDGLPIERERR